MARLWNTENIPWHIVDPGPVALVWGGRGDTATEDSVCVAWACQEVPSSINSFTSFPWHLSRARQ